MLRIQTIWTSILNLRWSNKWTIISCLNNLCGCTEVFSTLDIRPPIDPQLIYIIYNILLYKYIPLYEFPPGAGSSQPNDVYKVLVYYVISCIVCRIGILIAASHSYAFWSNIKQLLIPIRKHGIAEWLQFAKRTEQPEYHSNKNRRHRFTCVRNMSAI